MSLMTFVNVFSWLRRLQSPNRVGFVFREHNIMTEHFQTCAIARTAELIGDTYVILIIRDLMECPKRFGQLQESLQDVLPVTTSGKGQSVRISPKTLSQRLKLLEAAVVISRQAYAEVPPRVEYALTEKGRALSDIIEAMRAFGERYLPLEGELLTESA
jgi:DNA-binding HxlR family transcriptional regulator